LPRTRKSWLIQVAYLNGMIGVNLKAAA